MSQSPKQLLNIKLSNKLNTDQFKRLILITNKSNTSPNMFHNIEMKLKLNIFHKRELKLSLIINPYKNLWLKLTAQLLNPWFNNLKL